VADHHLLDLHTERASGRRSGRVAARPSIAAQAGHGDDPVAAALDRAARAADLHATDDEAARPLELEAARLDAPGREQLATSPGHGELVDGDGTRHPGGG